MNEKDVFNKLYDKEFRATLSKDPRAYYQAVFSPGDDVEIIVKKNTKNVSFMVVDSRLHETQFLLKDIQAGGGTAGTVGSASSFGTFGCAAGTLSSVSSGGTVGCAGSLS